MSDLYKSISSSFKANIAAGLGPKTSLRLAAKEYSDIKKIEEALKKSIDSEMNLLKLFKKDFIDFFGIEILEALDFTIYSVNGTPVAYLFWEDNNVSIESSTGTKEWGVTYTKKDQSSIIWFPAKDPSIYEIVFTNLLLY
jgi:hypothetical protein